MIILFSYKNVLSNVTILLLLKKITSLSKISYHWNRQPGNVLLWNDPSISKVIIDQVCAFREIEKCWQEKYLYLYFKTYIYVSLLLYDIYCRKHEYSHYRNGLKKISHLATRETQTLFCCFHKCGFERIYITIAWLDHKKQKKYGNRFQVILFSG